MELYVRNLPPDLDEKNFQSLFGAIGPIQKASLVFDRKTGESRGIGYVTYKNPKDAYRAIQELAGMKLGDHPLRIKPSQLTHQNAQKRKR